MRATSSISFVRTRTTNIPPKMISAGTDVLSHRLGNGRRHQGVSDPSASLLTPQLWHCPADLVLESSLLQGPDLPQSEDS